MQDPLRSVGTDDVRLNVAVYVQGNAKVKENKKKKKPTQINIAFQSPTVSPQITLLLVMYLSRCSSPSVTLLAGQ